MLALPMIGHHQYRTRAPFRASPSRIADPWCGVIYSELACCNYRPFCDGARDGERPQSILAMGSAMRIGLARLAVFAACLLMATAAAAQTYPTRQIRLVVPFAAGGPADLLARVIADEMSKDLGQQVFVDNRPGANTIIGAELVAKADPDGYTLLMAIDGTLVMNPFLYSKLSYDPFKDFAPVTLVARVPSVIEANNAVTASTVQDI